MSYSIYCRNFITYGLLVFTLPPYFLLLQTRGAQVLEIVFNENEVEKATKTASDILESAKTLAITVPAMEALTMREKSKRGATSRQKPPIELSDDEEEEEREEVEEEEEDEHDERREEEEGLHLRGGGARKRLNMEGSSEHEYGSHSLGGRRTDDADEEIYDDLYTV